MTIVAPTAESLASRDAPCLCDHCGLVVPRALVDPDTELQFCCGGCRVAFETIASCGLSEYYGIRDRFANDGQPSAGVGHRFAAYDTEVFQSKYVNELASSYHSIDFQLEGVHCAACVWLVERLPQIVPGVVEARLSLASCSARIVWNAKQTSLSTIAATLDRLGYAPRPASDASLREVQNQVERKQLARMGIAGALAGNNMLIALALYAGVFDGIEPRFLQLFRWLSMAIGWVSLVWPGRLFFRNAWAALSCRTVNFDVPISLALGVGAVAGTVNVLLDRGEVYFDSLSVLVFLLLVGRFIQSRQQRWAQDAVGKVLSLTPESCRVVRHGQLVEEPIELLEVGDEVEVRAGELFPADGEIIRGESTVDRSLLTGESRPQSVGPGDQVHAGVQNICVSLRVCVSAVGESTRVGQLIRRVEEGLRAKPAIVQFTDRIAGWFVALVVTVAMANLIWWSLTAGIAAAVESTVALLIVACPCALGLATPLTMAIAIGRASQQGVLVKSASALEILGRCDGSRTTGQLFFDKTGTLTVGELSVVAWQGDKRLLSYVAALEAESNHPVAKAITQYCNAEEIAAGIITNRSEQHGCGVSADSALGHLQLGSPRWIGSLGRNGRTEPPVDSTDYTCAKLAIDGCEVGEFLLADSVHADAVESLRLLRDMGWSTELISGDTTGAVEVVAAQLGFSPEHVHAEMSPEAKLARMVGATQRSREASLDTVGKCAVSHCAVMIGDGVNDAATLAAADVGIAVHGGAEAALAAADAYISKPGVGNLLRLVELSRRTMRVVHRNLAISLAYNSLAIALAAGGWVTPLVAAVLMPVSSATVLTAAIIGLKWPEPTANKRV